MSYKNVQNIAKQTMEYIKNEIQTGMSLMKIRNMCENKMLSLGADSFWYWNVGAFIFSGDETTLSLSGSVYITSDKKVKENDIITIDLSPQKGNFWGDYARTIVLENGIIKDVSDICNEEWKNGLLMEDFLHEELCKIATPNTTFEDIYYHINDIINSKGYKNLDFLSNLGHSIETTMSERKYIEKGNKEKISSAKCFTFEPHISKDNSKYGYKKEDIYYFENGELRKL